MRIEYKNFVTLITGLNDMMDYPTEPSSREAAHRLLRARKLRPRHRIILQYIYDYARQHGYAPSLREIGQAASIRSTSAVHYNLAQLMKWGFLCRTDNTSRSLILAEAAYPVMGKTAPQDLRAELIRLQLENRELRQRCDRLEGLLPSLS